MSRKKAPSESKSKKHKTKSKDSKESGYSGRSIWKGYVSFGLVNIPVVLVSAEKPREELHFKLLDKHNLAPIKYQRVNQETGEEVAWNDIVKGYEYETGTFAVLTEEDFESVAIENLKTIDIEDFIDLKDLDSIYFDKPYYLLPDKRGDKGYVLLRETLKQSKKVGIARVMIRTHQYLAAVIADGDALVVHTLRYPEEVKMPSELDFPAGSANDYQITKKEIEIAQQLVDTMSVKWNPKRYVNTYRDELLELVEKKVKSGKKGTLKHIKGHEVKQTNVVDFMDLLKKSVKDKKQAPSESKAKKSSKKGTPKGKKRAS